MPRLKKSDEEIKREMLSHYIKGYCARRGTNLQQLSKAVAVNYSTLCTQIQRGTVRYNTMVDIFRYLSFTQEDITELMSGGSK